MFVLYVLISGKSKHSLVSGSGYPSTSVSLAKQKDSSHLSSNSRRNGARSDSSSDDAKSELIQSQLMEIVQSELRLKIRSRSDFNFQKSAEQAVLKPDSKVLSDTDIHSLASKVVSILQNSSKISFDGNSKVSLVNETKSKTSLLPVSKTRTGNLIVNSTFLNKTILELLDNLLPKDESAVMSTRRTLSEVVESAVLEKINELQAKTEALDVQKISQDIIDLFNMTCKSKVSGASKVSIVKDDNSNKWRPAVSTNRSGEITINSRMLNDTIDRVLSAAMKFPSDKPSLVVIKDANLSSNDGSYDRRNASRSFDMPNGQTSITNDHLISDSERKVQFDENRNKSMSKSISADNQKYSSNDDSQEIKRTSFQVVSSPRNVKKPLYSARKVEPPQKTASRKKVKTQYAITRITTFDDSSNTYEVMRPMDRNPMQSLAGDGLGRDRPDVMFAVMPDRTTVCYSAI